MVITQAAGLGRKGRRPGVEAAAVILVRARAGAAERAAEETGQSWAQ